MFSEGEPRRGWGEDRPRLEAGTGTLWTWTLHQQQNNTFRFLIKNLSTPLCCLLVAKCKENEGLLLILHTVEYV